MFGTSSVKQTPIASLTSKIQGLEDRYALKTYVDQKIADVVANAPEVLDTLQELSAALGDNPNVLYVIQNNLNNEIDRATAAEEALSTAISTIGSGSLTLMSTLLGQEIIRATAAENSLSTALFDETARALAAEEDLRTTISSVTSTLQSEFQEGLASTTTYIDNAISTVVAGAPAILDTLNEIATALNGDPQAVINLTSSIQESNKQISSVKSYVDSTALTLQSHGLQSYNATPLVHRRKYTGPYTPSQFSTLYSVNGKNPYEHISNLGSIVILQPTADDTTTFLPPYTTTWNRVGTLDLTNATASNPCILSQFINPSSGSSIPYYDIYIQPKMFYGQNADYGFVKGTADAPPIQVHSGHILTYTNVTNPYSSIQLGGTWSAFYRDDIPELERVVKITNGNIAGIDSLNLFINAGSTIFEIAPQESTSFFYTNFGWTLFGKI